MSGTESTHDTTQQSQSNSLHVPASLLDSQKLRKDSCRVVIIDDNPDLRVTLELLLKEDGYEAVSTDTGMSGLHLIEELRPDVAIIDIGLPGMNGYEVARAIRSKPLGNQLFLIAMTGFGEQEDQEKAFEAGFDAHLTKPVELAQLEQLLEQPPLQQVPSPRTTGSK